MTVRIALTVNVHGVGPEAVETPESELFARFAHGRYAYTVGLARLLDLFERRGLMATFFWPVSEAKRAPRWFEACLKAGHEIGAHGLAFEDLMTMERPAEEDLLARMTEELTRLAGTKPKGFRSATGTLSYATLPILARLGYRYDASFIDDDAPYALDGDGAPGLIELPWFEGLSDAYHFGRRLTQARAEVIMTEELDALLPVAGYGALVLHPRSDIGAARAARLVMIERLIARAETRFGARFATCAEIAAEVEATA